MKPSKHKERRSYENFLKHLDFVKESTLAGMDAFEVGENKAKRIEKLCANYNEFFQYYFPHYCTDEQGTFSECADFHVEFANMVKKDITIKIAQQWGRGLAKSVHSNMGIPMWLWACGESMFEACIGNSHDAALRLLDDVRAEFSGNQRLINDFGWQPLVGKWEEGDFQTRDGKFIGKALGMGQNVRGLRVGPRRPNYTVCDDLEDAKTVKNPVRQNEIAEWIKRALIPTMVGKVRRFINANNRFAPQTIQTLLVKKTPGMKVHRIDACDKVTFEPRWPQRDTKEKYQAMAADGILAFLSEFCNEPHIEGSIFLADDIVYVNPANYPRLHKFNMIAAYWDVAYGGTETSDFNAITIWGVKNKKYYHIATYCRQSKMKPALVWLAHFVKSKRTEKPMHCYYESQFWNDAVRDTIRQVEKEESVDFNFYKHERNKTGKYDRILTLQPYFQRREILFSEGDMANPDAQVGLTQLFGIEPGYKGHDDWPDAVEGCISLLHYHTKTSEWSAPITGRNTRSKYSY